MTFGAFLIVLDLALLLHLVVREVGNLWTYIETLQGRYVIAGLRQFIIEAGSLKIGGWGLIRVKMAFSFNPLTIPNKERDHENEEKKEENAGGRDAKKI